MLGYRLYRIKGQSMAPTLSPGDTVVLRARAAKTDDIVVVNHPRYGVIIKRINTEGGLSGDGDDSTSPEKLGRYDAATLIGVAVLAITPSGIRRLSSRRSANRA